LQHIFLFIFFCFFCLQKNFAQQLNFSRTQLKKIPVEQHFILDSLNIVSESVNVFDTASHTLLDTSYYEIDAVKATITWKKIPDTDSVWIEYKTFPFNLSKSFMRKQITIEQYQEQDFILNPFSYVPSKSNVQGIDFGNIDYNGSFTRGLSFGNNQDVVLNSSLNLQLAGNITNDIEIVAALTDNNIPVQPDGNTQQIQEFDKIYIQAGNKHHQVVLGDYDVQCFNRYFMRFFKRLQGMSYRGNIDVNRQKNNFTTNTSLALARGKFTRNQLRIIEGNQGPYRLTGSDGETFIIILAGTERVFLNGQLLRRGADSDYIIDYNTGEITFMPSVIIKRDSRIFVEFEYAVRSYFRTILYTANDFSINNKLKFNLNFYSEQDNKNQPVQEKLSNEQKQILRMAGSDVENTFFRGYELQQYEPGRILYKLVDTIVNGFSFDSVFVYSINPDSARYRVVFSDVGAGNGNYIRASSSANGTVFAWVAPDISGRKNGSYEPITILISPKREQLLTTGLEYNDDKNKLFIDLAMSNDDVNTFSDKDNNDNLGAASRLNYERRFYLNDSDKKNFYLAASSFYEYVHKNFSPLERYRPVEFNRDYNLLPTAQKIDEHWSGAGIALVKIGKGKAGYQFSNFQKANYYNGFRHVITGDYLNKGYYVDFNFRIVQSNDTLSRGLYLWPRIDVAKSFARLKHWKIGGRFEKEDNKLYTPVASDSLITRSFLFDEWRVYVASSDSATDKLRLEYMRRQEFFPRRGEMKLATTSNTYNLSGEWMSKEWQQLRYRLTYRQFVNVDSMFTENKIENFYLGRIEYNIQLWKGFVNLNNLYELGSGREQRRAYSFLEVPAGQGNYMWASDYNNNGIADLNEFEIAPPGFEDQAKYIKVFNSTNEFLPINTTAFNTSVNLNPRVRWYAKKSIKGLLARFSTQTSIQLNRKVFRFAEVSPFNPFVMNVDNDFLIALGSVMRQSVFFNRSSSIYGIEYNWQDNRNKQNLTNGFEIRQLTEHALRIRWNILKSLNISNRVSLGNKGNRSELFTERNYDIRYYTIEPELTYLYQTKFRAMFLYKFTDAKNLIGEKNEKALTHDFSTDLRYNIVNKSSINARITYAMVNYQGGNNDAIQFAMLQGLRNGSNYLWSVSFDTNLAANIQLNLAYDGRKTGESKIIHTGRAQVRAIF
jgi:hypothetical protein